METALMIRKQPIDILYDYIYKELEVEEVEELVKEFPQMMLNMCFEFRKRIQEDNVSQTLKEKVSSYF